MQNWGRTRRFLIYPAVNFLNNRRSNPIAADPVFNSAFGLANHRDSPLYSESEKSNLHTCFHSLRDKVVETGIRSAIRFQHRGFGSDATKIQRNPLFSTLNSEDISYFKGVLGEKNVIQDEERLLTANTDWMHKYRGSSKLLLQPRSTEEVSQILKYCNSRSLAVVPQGGNTGLVGGSVPVFDEVVINVSLMNNIISFDKDLINSSNRILVKNTTKMMFYEL